MLFLCLGCLGSTVQSQNLTLGASLNPGISKVSSNRANDDNWATNYTWSGNVGLFLERKVGRSSALGIEALWVQLEGKDVSKQEELRFSSQNGTPPEVVGVAYSTNKFHSSYLGLPIYYRYQWGKIGIKAGAQPLLFLFANTRFQSTGEVRGAPFDVDNRTTGARFERIDLGPKVGLDYALGQKFRLRADYYHGLTDIIIGELGSKRKNRQLNLGLSYLFGRQG